MSLQEHIHKNRIEHVIQRAKERYDLRLTPKDVEFVEFRMFFTSCPLIRPLHRSGEVFLYAVRVKGSWLPFIFDMIDRQAVTVYPDNHLRIYRRELDNLKKQFKKKYSSMPDHPLWGEVDKPKIEFPVTSQQIWEG